MIESTPENQTKLLIAVYLELQSIRRQLHIPASDSASMDAERLTQEDIERLRHLLQLAKPYVGT